MSRNRRQRESASAVRQAYVDQMMASLRDDREFCRQRAARTQRRYAIAIFVARVFTAAMFILTIYLFAKGN